MFGFDAYSEAPYSALPGGAVLFVFCDSASRIVIGGGVGGDKPAPTEWRGALQRDFVSVIEALVAQQRDGGSLFEITKDAKADSASRLEALAAVLSSPVVLLAFGTDMVGVASIVPVSFKGTILRDFITGTEAEGTIVVTDSQELQMEILLDVTRLSAVPVAWQSILSFDWPIPMEDFAGLKIDTGPFQIERLNDSTSDTTSLLDIAIQIINLLEQPTEWAGTLEQRTPSGAESLVGQRRDGAGSAEHTFDVKPSSKVPMETGGSGLSETSGMPVDHTAAERRDAAGLAEHTIGVPVDTAAQVERTVDVKRLTPSPLEKTFDVRPLFIVPVQFAGTVHGQDAVFPIEAKGAMLVDTREAVERLATLRRDTPSRVERLGGVDRRTPVLVDRKGTVDRDSAGGIEHTGDVRASSSAPVAIDGGIQGEFSPARVEWRGTLAGDRPSPAEFRGTLSRDMAGLAEYLAGIRSQPPTVALEHLGTITGLTPSRAAYSASIRADRPVPAELLSAVATSAAFAVERLGAVQRADTTTRVEWRGSLRVDLPMSAERLASLLADSPAVPVEITMEVHADGFTPINFYGYALITQVPLQGSKVAVQLEGERAPPLLEGEQAAIVLLGEIK